MSLSQFAWELLLLTGAVGGVCLLGLRRKRRRATESRATKTKSRVGLAFRLRFGTISWPQSVIEGEFLHDQLLHYTILVYDSQCTCALSDFGVLDESQSDHLYQEVFQAPTPEDYLTMKLTHGNTDFEIWEGSLQKQVRTNDGNGEVNWRRVMQCLGSLGLIAKASSLSKHFPGGTFWC